MIKGMGAYTDTKSKDIKIFIIGDSTVYNKDFPDGNGGFHEMGWAQKEALGNYMIQPSNLFNKGRSGASSKSYKTINNNLNDWEETKNLIKNTDISSGAYLLIQFGHNDEKVNQPYGTTPDKFYEELDTYINWAKNNGMKPVLITPVERRAKYYGHNNRKTHITNEGDYAQTVRDLAEDKGVLLLDLQDRSWNEYNTYENTDTINKIFAYDDNTHFSPKGAKIVAGWVKDLACESSDETLCGQFK
ncbi:MAG TPA: hypothetical protein EYM49_02340 [Campylobacterales bacterium]|nr:hypothetical protein [Campylobacterales bacterium]